MRLTRRIVLAVALLATLGAGALIATASAASKSRTRTFSGHFTFHLAPPPCAGLFCVRGVMHGSVVSGTFDEMIATSTAAGPDRPGVYTGLGTITIHTRNGDLVCDQTYVFNLTPVGDKEGGIICTIRSGTGKLKGATGHLELLGSQPTGSAPGSMGSGLYAGKLKLP
jgi:hypothetical protein